jgi:lysophospholipase L1-like esterase
VPLVRLTTRPWEEISVDDTEYAHLAASGLLLQSLDRPIAGGVRWVPLGDSLSSQQSGGAPYNQWVDLAAMRSDGKLMVAANAGVSGDNTTQMLARVDSVLAYSPQLVTVMGGTNDITQAVAFDTTKDNLAAIVKRLRNNGVTVCMATVPPRFDTTKIGATTKLNSWIRQHAAANGCHLLDVHKATVHRTDGKYAAGFPVSDGDNVHMLRAGHSAIADAFLTDVLPKLPAAQVTRPVTNADTNNLITNGLLITQGSGVATGWVASGATTGLTEQLVVDNDFLGSAAWEVGLVTPSAFRQYAWTVNPGPWAVGDKLLFVAKYKITASANVPLTSGLAIQANFFSAANPTNYMTRYQQTNGFTGLVAQEFTVPAATTLVQLAFIFTPSAAGTLTVRVGEAGIFNLTNLAA